MCIIIIAHVCIIIIMGSLILSEGSFKLAINPPSIPQLVSQDKEGVRLTVTGVDTMVDFFLVTPFVIVAVE